ncbi:MAG: YceD family protein [Thermodesulfobacteriota bacterium]
MKIRVSDIRDEGLPIHTHMSPEWLDNIPELSSGEDNLRLISDIEVDLLLTKSLREITVIGGLSFSLETPCSRCLENTSFDIKADIRLMLSPADKVKDIDDVDHEVYRGDDVDLDDYLKGLIAASLPVKVVCSEDCKGLCPNCGKNLNRGKCECENEWVDPRFAALRKLKI